jgi:predicted PurR-regulated permease PerM
MARIIMNELKKVDISTGIIFRTILIILGIWLLYLVRDVIALFFIAIILASAMEPGVNWMHRKRIPRSLGILLIYIALFSLIGLAIYFMVPIIAKQFNDFANNFPIYSEKVSGLFSGFRNYTDSHNINIGGNGTLDFSQSFSRISQGLFSTTVGVFSGILSLVIVLSVTFYLSVKEDGMKKFIIMITPLRHEEYAISLFERMKNKIGRWMIGQIFIMAIVFALVFILLFFLKVPYALILAIIAGLLEVVPFIGPIIAGTLATLLGFLVSPVVGFTVLIVFIIIQQVESNLITPQVMKRVVGLNPIAVILALLIGAKLGGVLGAILAIPVVTAAAVFVGDLMNKSAAIFTEGRKKED